MPPVWIAGSEDASSSGRKAEGGIPRGKLLPRGDVLILGGDLAYPNPSTETYELRFVGPFEQALPPPPVRLPTSTPSLDPLPVMLQVLHFSDACRIAYPCRLHAHQQGITLETDPMSCHSRPIEADA